MSRFRLFLACLLLAALPLQGMAAASMLFCGSQSAARVAQAASHHGHQASMRMAAHNHDSHGHGADSSLHGQAAFDSDAPSGDTGDEGSGQSHACPVCASCAQAQAVGGFELLRLPLAAPSEPPRQAHVRVSTRTLSLPDKPPRG